jgi:hypothetical protein
LAAYELSGTKFEPRITNQTKHRKNTKFFGVDWLRLILILLDTPTAKQGQFFARPTYSSPGKGGSLCGGLGYRALVRAVFGGLKKKSLPCRYCTG